jgi:ADP-ribose pyrophosphatase YjhB (NUDIX family)
MEKNRRTNFNPKKEVSVMAWIENDQGAVLLVRQAVGQKLWTLPGGKVKRTESLERALRREVREETGLSVSAIVFRQMYDRPKRGAISILFRVSVQRQAAQMRFPVEEIADLGFFDRLPEYATPSVKFFWNLERLTTSLVTIASRETDTIELRFKDQRP